MKLAINILAIAIPLASSIDCLGQVASIESLLDPTFSPHFEGSVSALAVQPDGKIIVGGDFHGGSPDFHPFLARLHPDGTLDASFDSGFGPTNNTQCQYDSVATIAATDDSIFVGGRLTSFNGVTRSGIAKLTPDGALDDRFNVILYGISGGCAVPGVTSIVVQKDGKVLIAGDFDAVNGDRSLRQIARLNADGSLDGTFRFSASVVPSWIGLYGHPHFELNAIALQEDGKLIVAGRFGAVNGIPRNSIARLNLDGSVDQSFDPEVTYAAGYSDGLPGYVRSAIVQPEGKILIGGNFQRVRGLRQDSIARLGPDGTLDTSFYPGLASDAGILAIALQADGKVLAAGSGDWNGLLQEGLFRFKSGLTTPYVQFASTNHLCGEHSGIASIPVQRIGDSSGTMTIDYFTSQGTATSGVDYLARSGTLSFAPGEAIKYIDVRILDDPLSEPDESLIVNLKNPRAGTLLVPASAAVVRILDDDRPGSLDLSFSPPQGTSLGGTEIASGGITRLFVQPNGRIWVRGVWMKGTPFWCALNPDGSLDLDPRLDPELNDPLAIGVQSDGRAIVSDFGDGSLYRINGDGSTDWTYTTCCADRPGGIVGIVLPDDKVVLSGSPLRRINASGGYDSSFNGPVFKPLDFRLNAIALQQDGRLLIGGRFTAIGGVKRTGIARLLSNGEVDKNFDPSLAFNTNVASLLWERGYGSWETNPIVTSAFAQSDGKVVVAGQFSIPNDSRRNNFARFNSDGSLDTSFARGEVSPNEMSTSAVLQQDGRIIVASVGIPSGSDPFGAVGSALTRLTPDGSVDKSFDIGTGLNGAVEGMTWQPDGKLLIWGYFTEANGLPRVKMARLNVQSPLKVGLITRPSDGELSLALASEPGRTYVLQTSSDLNTWFPLQTNTATDFSLRFEDIEGSTNLHRFYRARQLNP